MRQEAYEWDSEKAIGAILIGILSLLAWAAILVPLLLVLGAI
jgi:hypothetical protein